MGYSRSGEVGNFIIWHNAGLSTCIYIVYRFRSMVSICCYVEYSVTHCCVWILLLLRLLCTIEGLMQHLLSMILQGKSHLMRLRSGSKVWSRGHSRDSRFMLYCLLTELESKVDTKLGQWHYQCICTQESQLTILHLPGPLRRNSLFPVTQQWLKSNGWSAHWAAEKVSHAYQLSCYPSPFSYT